MNTPKSTNVAEIASKAQSFHEKMFKNRKLSHILVTRMPVLKNCLDTMPSQCLVCTLYDVLY